LFKKGVSVLKEISGGIGVACGEPCKEFHGSPQANPLFQQKFRVSG